MPCIAWCLHFLLARMISRLCHVFRDPNWLLIWVTSCFSSNWKRVSEGMKEGRPVGAAAAAEQRRKQGRKEGKKEGRKERRGLFGLGWGLFRVDQNGLLIWVTYFLCYLLFVLLNCCNICVVYMYVFFIVCVMCLFMCYYNRLCCLLVACCD